LDSVQIVSNIIEEELEQLATLLLSN